MANTNKKTAEVLIKKLQSNAPRGRLNNRWLNIQVNHLTKSSLHSGKTVSDIPMDSDQAFILFLLLWLDMSHDGLLANIKINNYQEFLASDIMSQFIPKNKNNLLLNLQTKALNLNLKEEYKRIFNKLIKIGAIKIEKNNIVKMTDFEKKIKADVHEIFYDEPNDDQKPIRTYKTTDILPLVKKSNKEWRTANPIYISPDAEHANYIATMMSKTKNENSNTYYAKRLYTIANLVDPGRFGGSKTTGGGAVNTLVNKLWTKPTNSGTIVTPYKYNLQLFTFNFGEYFTIKFDADAGSKDFKFYLNDEELTLGITAAKATTTEDSLLKISKTFGDFLQIMTVSHLRKHMTDKRNGDDSVGNRIISSTQDGMFIGMTAYVQRYLYNMSKFAILVDFSTKVGSNNVEGGGYLEYHGLNAYLRKPGQGKENPSGGRPERSDGQTRQGLNRLQQGGTAAAAKRSVKEVKSGPAFSNSGQTAVGKRPNKPNVRSNAESKPPNGPKLSPARSNNGRTTGGNGPKRKLSPTLSAVGSNGGQGMGGRTPNGQQKSKRSKSNNQFGFVRSGKSPDKGTNQFRSERLGKSPTKSAKPIKTVKSILKPAKTTTMKRSETPAEKRKRRTTLIQSLAAKSQPTTSIRRTRLVQSLAAKSPPTTSTRRTPNKSPPVKSPPTTSTRRTPNKSSPVNSSPARSIRRTPVINPPLRSVATSAARAGL